MTRVLLGTVAAAIAGFLTRPCCIVPAVLALGGTGSAALANATVAYRPAFLAASAVLLAASMWFNVRLQTRPLNKWLVAIAATASFLFTARPEWFAGVW